MWLLPFAAACTLDTILRASEFQGHTNTNSDTHIRDISQIMRPHFNVRYDLGAFAGHHSTHPSALDLRSDSERRKVCKHCFATTHYSTPFLHSQNMARSQKLRDQHSEAEAAALGYQQAAASQAETFPIDTNAQLQLVFQYYCRFGRTGGHSGEDTMDNVNFAKFARECPRLLDRRLDRTEVDLIFTKVKAKGKRRITYSQWLDALAAMASVKIPREDPATAFSVLLSRYVFNCPASQGVGAMAQAGQLDLHAMTAGKGQAAAFSDQLYQPEYSSGELTQPPPGRHSGAAHLADTYPSEHHHAQAQYEPPSSATRVPTEGYLGQLGSPPPPTRPRSARRSPHTTMSGVSAAPSQGYRTAAAAHAAYRHEDEHAARLSRSLGSSVPRPRSAVPHSPRTPLSARRRSSSRDHALMYGDDGYQPTLAGQGNKPGGVYDRLSSPASFTGVYKRAYETDGRINAFADTGVSAKSTKYRGSTNTGSNETIHNIKYLLRPNLKSGKTFK